MKSSSKKKTKKQKQKVNLQAVLTRETLGVVLMLFSALAMVCLITREVVFSLPGEYVNSFLFGCFGYFAYAVVLGVFLFGLYLTFDIAVPMKTKHKVLMTIFFFLAAFITHIITMTGKNLEFKEYVLTSYNMAFEGGFMTASGGGLFIALLAQPVTALLSDTGTYVIAGICAALTVFFFIKDIADGNASESTPPVKQFKGSYVKEGKNTANYGEQTAIDMDKSQSDDNLSLFVNNPQNFAFKNKRELARDATASGLKVGYSQGGMAVASTPNAKDEPLSGADYEKKLDYIRTPSVPDIEIVKNNGEPLEKPYYVKPETPSNNYSQGGTTISDYVNTRNVSNPQNSSQIPFIEHENSVTVSGDSALERSKNYDRYYTQNPESRVAQNTVNDDVVYRAVRDGRIEEINDTPINNGAEIPFIEEEFSATDSFNQGGLGERAPRQSSISSDRRVRDILGSDDRSVGRQMAMSDETLGFTSRVNADNNASSRNADGDAQTQASKQKKVEPPINRKYYRPPLDLLENYAAPVGAPRENHEERMEIIQKTLEEFHINAVPQGYVHGPSITRYEVMMPAGVSVKKVLNYDDDLKMRLSAKDGVRIEAPIPGKNLVGIEVANSVKTTVGLREILEGYSVQKGKEGALMFALGKDLVGKPILDDLSKGPHYLVAGATGSGKSVCLNLMIVSLIMRYSPEDLRLILVDPKGVEFINYEHIPHLMIDEIITEPKKALAVLSWAYNEMERRFAVFRENGGGLVVNIDDYNSVVASKTVARMPRIVIIIDELADLMETCKKDLEARIRAIAQKARAAGIHLVLATQRPSVDIITGTIKANLPSRIAFKVMNFNDSQTILSEAGAEKLLGNGDMLYKNTRMSAVERYQGAYISGREVNNVVAYIKEHNKAYFDDELKEFLDKESRPKQEENTSSEGGGESGPREDELFLKALWLAVTTQTVSISQLQRRFQIGYSRAGGLVDSMERMGFISGNEGAKARKVYLTREQFEERFGSMPDQ